MPFCAARNNDIAPNSIPDPNLNPITLSSIVWTISPMDTVDREKLRQYLWDHVVPHLVQVRWKILREIWDVLKDFMP